MVSIGQKSVVIVQLLANVITILIVNLLILFVTTIGVLIVQIAKYVIILVVKVVSLSRSPHIKDHNFGILLKTEH